MIVDRLGQGGMASLYLARDPAIDRLVAIKMLRDGFDAELRERFAREARSAGRLRHLNIVTIFDVGEHEGEPFIAMEYVEGETLSEMIRRRVTLGLARRLELLESLCAGLGYAHQVGIVHRDIKPANIMVDRDWVLKILDFGIARAGDSSMTQAGMLVGTLNYMSPEQVAGEPIDQRSDIFAVGSVCYEFISYRQAFPGNLQTGILHRIMTEQPEALDAIAPVDADLARIVCRALAKNAADRYPDLGVMRRELARVRRQLPEDTQSIDQEPTIAIGAPVVPVTPRSTRRTTNVEDLERRRAGQIDAHLAAARGAEEGGDFQKAIDAAEQVLMLDRGHAGALELLDRVRTAQDRAKAAEWLAQATGALERDALTEAALLLDRSVEAGLDPAGAEVEGVKAALERARQARERASAAQALVERARAALSAGSFESALQLADEALALVPGRADARDVGAQASRAIHERRREEEAARAREAVRAARECFASGDQAAAVAALEAYSPAHDIVTDALVAMKADRDAHARRLREAEDEARRRAEAERRERESQRLRLIASARAAAAKARFDESLESLARAEAVADDTREIESVRAEVEAAKTAAVAARERAQQQRARIAEAQQALRTGAFGRARELAAAALALDAGDDAARKLMAQAERDQADADARQERERERDRRIEEAEGRLGNRDLASARQAITRALALDSKHGAARRLEERIAAAESEAAQAAAARRKVEAALDKARRAAARPERAAALAQQALALDPQNVEAQQLLNRAQAAVAERAEKDKARPVKGSAERDTPADVRPRRSIRRHAIPAAAVVVLTAAIAGAIAVQMGRDSNRTGREKPQGNVTTGATEQSASAKANVPAPAPPPVSTVDRPSATVGVGGAPSGDVAANAQLDDLRNQAREHRRRGKHEDALATATRALAIDREDRGILALLGQLVSDARSAASKARSAATGQGARQGPQFERAQQAEHEADRLRIAGKAAEAIRAYWKAQSWYSDAGRNAEQMAKRPASPSPSLTAPPQTGEAARPEPRNTPAPPITLLPAPAGSDARSAGPPPPAATAGGATRGAEKDAAAANTFVADESSIRDVLTAYRAAYESLDAGAVRRVQPSLTGEQLAMLQKSFSDFRAYSVVISDVAIKLAGTRATVSCRVTRRYTPKAGRPDGNTRATVFHLAKNGGAWAITRVETR